MRKAQKEEVLEFIKSLGEAQEEIKAMLEKNRKTDARELIVQCQDFAIQLGKNIERLENDKSSVIESIEVYCESLYRIYEQLDTDVNVNKIYKILKKQLLRIENEVKNDIPVRREVAFFPYKASMWDSLESIYLAASADPNCDAYCVPIPYFDVTKDHRLGQMHYEGREFPANIRVIDWETYQFEKRKPDVIFIHNPYDDCNLVTSVHPRYYSSNLKKYTDTLVYVPYFVTTGRMSEGQGLCPAYINADYIVIQNSKIREYYHPAIPNEKFLPLGSPKLDRVINVCKNPPEPPAAWKEQMEGKKVYFYNTSISGMLKDTEQFLKKLQYVFRCFEKNEKSCILWRPHPLLESTFDSMRPQYKPIYENLRNYFLSHRIGIYDTTSDITNSIALSDVYIGDQGTSVTSLFGIAGKPIFLLDNRIHEKPQEGDWRAEIILGMTCEPYNKWMVTQGNMLYKRDKDSYQYRFYCELPDQGNRWSYAAWPYEVGNKLYICPTGSQELVVIDENQGIERVAIDKYKVEGSAFRGGREFGKYLVLFPNAYPEVVRYDAETGELKYFLEPVDVNVYTDEAGIKLGGLCKLGDDLYFASPVDKRMLRMRVSTGELETIELPIQNNCGCVSMVPYGKEIWLMPYEGNVVTVWNIETNEVREYPIQIDGLQGMNPNTKEETSQYLFTNVALNGEYAYLAPNWGNAFVKLNRITGEVTQWIPPFEQKETDVYFRKVNSAGFIVPLDASDQDEEYLLFSHADKSMHEINLQTNTSREVAISFDEQELKEHAKGFAEHQVFPYGCMEGLFHSLPDFLNEETAGKMHDKEKQIEAFRNVTENCDGTCGEKVYEYINANR